MKENRDDKCNVNLVDDFKNYRKRRQNMVFLNKNDNNEKFDNVQTWSVDENPSDSLEVETSNNEDGYDEDKPDTTNITNIANTTNITNTASDKKLIIISNILISPNKNMNTYQSSIDYG